jgi:hypothetical protein
LKKLYFTTLSVSFTITLAIKLPTSRLSSALPTAPVDPSASTGLSASGDAVSADRPTGFSRLTRTLARPVFAMLVALACASFAQVTMAQMPKPINPGTSVTQTPLDYTRTQSGATASGTPATSGAAASAAASEPEDPNGFSARQKALDERSEENTYRFGVKQHDCYSNFFVNHCLNQAREAKREVSQQIRKEQLALDDEQRLQHAQQRDEQTAIKRARYESEAPQRAASEKASSESFAEKQRQNELSAAQRNAEAPQRAQNQAAYDRKQADYQKKLNDAAARGVQEARDRDDKAARYEAKQRDAAEHQAQVEARQKEAAIKQQQRAQQEAADRQHQEQLKQQQQQQPK